MNFFDFFGLEPKFQLDGKALKMLYYEKMKDFHPDMQINASPQEQAEILQKSSLNNKAYKTLKDFHARLKYILETYYPGEEEPSKVLPQMFLMEMMDMNDELMELKMDFDSEKASKMEKELRSTLDEMETDIQSVILDKTVTDQDISTFDKINEYLLKRNYLLRAISNLTDEAN